MRVYVFSACVCVCVPPPLPPAFFLLANCWLWLTTLMVLTPWRSDWPVTRYWPPRKVQTLAAMKDRGWHRRDMMVMAGAQCAHLLGRHALTAVQLVSGCWILVLTEERAHLVKGEGEVPVVIMGPSLDGQGQVQGLASPSLQQRL